MGELRQIQPEDDTRRKMLDILKRFHCQEEGDDDDIEMNDVDDDDEDGIIFLFPFQCEFVDFPGDY